MLVMAKPRCLHSVDIADSHTGPRHFRRVGELAGQQSIPDLTHNGYKRSRYPFRCDRRPQELREMGDGDKRCLCQADKRIV